VFAPLFTASGLDALVRCAGSATLPTVEEDVRDDSLAVAGTATHDRMLRSGGLPLNLEQWVTHDGQFCRPFYEVRFLVDFSDPSSVRNISAGADGRSAVLIGERYGVASPRCSAGTCDAFAYLIDGGKIYLRVPDLKTGAGQAAGRLPPPAESWQLRYYALAILLWLGWPDKLALGSCEVAFWVRDSEAGPDAWRIDAAALSDELLRDSLAQLHELTVKLTSRPSSLWSEGPWCASCTKFRACPVQQSPIRKLGIAMAGRIDEAAVRQVAESVGTAKRLVAQAETVLDRYVARYGPLSLTGGSVLHRVRETRQNLTVEALPVLRTLLTDEQYREAVREETSQARLIQAVGNADASRLLAHLRDVPGAIEETVTFRLRERRGRKD